MSDSTGVVWFRRDLRLADNPALRAAVDAHDRLVALFVHDPALAKPSGANRLVFLHRCLDALDEDLDGLLVERHGDPAAVVAAVAAEVDAEAVYVAEDFGPYGKQRDDAVEEALLAAGRTLERVGSPYAIPPDTLFTGGGTPFKVFTPFSRAWRAHGWDAPVAAPRSAVWLEGVDGGRGHGERPATPDPDATDGLPDGGEAAAHRLADAFLADRVDDYTDDRNRPDLDRTSRLSPHLKYGTVHPRQLLARLGGSGGATTWAGELCWRDFYADVLHHRPETARRNYAAAMDGLEWDTGKRADQRFEAWCRGETGYPIVDAGMRQLLAEGWIHNRVRMITASFLVKDLHVDWTRGARWFLQHLVDGDLASNNHGWQWTAGTGTDAAPFFRIFNPTAQGLRFDPSGDYVRRYVPELRGIEGKAVHEPAKAGGDDLFGGGAGGYPEPIVDHKAEREEALARYQRR
ncbi:DNA photolyase family protein [Aquihabitans sp. G128]|uniref:cryptochrome/photolyase family protein n=1 Tax=Aquihabitans sp. G128 TaxID=2849779 RepID=UPI001C22BE98|nr:deoxyribodipyrimidine photo-lyase [Aquihabitans sp. G128]QXC61550.1 DNA photolyase family protein [Aquihabitans sp. G128]